MKLKQMTKTLGLEFLLSIFLFSSIAISADAAVTDDDDILDMIMPILTSLPQKQAIPLNRAEAVSFPYGVTDDLFKPLPVMCPDRTAAKNNDIKNCKGITARQVELHKLITDFYSNTPVCGMGGKIYPGIQEPNFDGSITAKDSSVMDKIQNNSDMKKSFDACSYRDMTAFNGLICISDTLMYGLKPDQSIGCKAVKDAQSADGRMWRSPFRKAINNFDNLSESFSDDMNLGVLLYSIATKDKTLLKNWMSWIDTNTPCTTEKSEVVCSHQYMVTPEVKACNKWDGNILKYPPLGKCTGTYVVTAATYACDTYKTQQSCLLRALPTYCSSSVCSLLPWYVRMIEEIGGKLGVGLPTQLKSYNNTLDALLTAGTLSLAFSDKTIGGVSGDKQLISSNIGIPIIDKTMGEFGEKIVKKMPISLTLPVAMSLSTGISAMNRSANAVDYIALGSKYDDVGFPLHLEGVRIFLLRLSGINKKGAYKEIANKVGENISIDSAAQELFRRQPLNPFFSYLADGGPKKSASQTTIDLFNKQCPSSHIADKYHHDEWAWQIADVDDKNNPIEAWKSGSLWDCRFMAQLLYSNPVK